MPWRDQVGAIIEAWYPGQRGGEAIANVLFGRADASGRLPMTFPAVAVADRPSRSSRTRRTALAPSGRRSRLWNGARSPAVLRTVSRGWRRRLPALRKRESAPALCVRLRSFVHELSLRRFSRKRRRDANGKLHRHQHRRTQRNRYAAGISHVAARGSRDATPRMAGRDRCCGREPKRQRRGRSASSGRLRPIAGQVGRARRRVRSVARFGVGRVTRARERRRCGADAEALGRLRSVGLDVERKCQRRCLRSIGPNDMPHCVRSIVAVAE